jgi:hypothetical protein
LTSLEGLNLNGTKVSDTGLTHLKRLVNLKTLSLTHTKVTASGAQAMERSLPGVRIRR